MLNIAVLVSGGGTNLQALLDSEARGENPNGKITLVVASKPGVFALERAAKAGVEGCVVRRKDYAASEEFDAALLETLRAHKIDLVVLAGFLAGDPTITLASVVALSLGIAIQNVPEGAVVSLPLTANGMSRPKALLAGTLCGAVEPVGAVLMVAITGLVTPLLPYVLAFNSRSRVCRERFMTIAAAMGLQGTFTPDTAAPAVIQFVRQLSAGVGIPANLAQLNKVDPADFAALAELALHDTCMSTNQITPTRGEVVAVYTAAFRG